MANNLNAIPSGPHAITPYLTVKGAAKGIEFYKQAFGAVETMRWTGPDGRIGHAEIEIGGTPVFISDEHPEIDVVSPETLGGSAVGLHLMVEDADATSAARSRRAQRKSGRSRTRSTDFDRAN